MNKFLLIIYLMFITDIPAKEKSWIRINQLGYLTEDIKVAVFVSKKNIEISEFNVYDAQTENLILSSRKVKSFGKYGAFNSTARLDFSELKTEGEFYIKAADVSSPKFKINNKIYDGTADFLLNYMWQQRCGYNPVIKDSCHTHDGFIVDHPEKTGKYIDVKGGWHDASDYLQYVTTTANAVYQLLFAYQQNKEVFGDLFDANGNNNPNGNPDILDEAKWGLDWLIKMNPEYGVMFNQIADDRDHSGYKLPNQDSVNYGMPFGRPVYFLTGKKQGICKHLNRTTGVSSTAGKFSSAFGLGAKVFNELNPEYAQLLRKKSFEAYEFAKTDLGVSQTACCKSPYFYEEDNYVDDLELAAIQLYINTNEKNFLEEAAYWGEIEPVTPWMGADSARHYQWYPFVNLGHYYLALSSDKKISDRFKNYLWQGINRVYRRGKDNPFQIGIPFIWCSNNLVAAILTHMHLYKQATNNDMYDEMEASLRDWLFGCNPWGTSMIIGLPENGDSPTDTHNCFWVKENYQPVGGLVDGPIYNNIFKYLIGLTIVNGDEYSEFQSDEHVYHDDYGDYSTNEPTMDGTASLTYYLSSLEKSGKEYGKK